MIIEESVLGQETIMSTTSSLLGDGNSWLNYKETNNSQSSTFEVQTNNFSTRDPINNTLPNLTATEADLLTGTANGEVFVGNDRILTATARSAASFVDSIATSGVNKKYDWDRVRAIADDIGIKNFRNLTKHENGPGTGVERLIGNDYTFTVSVGVNTGAIDPSPQGISQLLAAIKNKHLDYRSRITALEGPNEYDFVDPVLDPDWPGTLRAFVKELYQQMRADPWFDEIPYVGPSFAREDSMQKLGDISAYIDAGNLHLYTNPPVDGDRFSVKYSGYVSENLPLYTTEIGNNTKTATEEIEQARLYPRMYLVNFDRGIIRSHGHVLIDGDSNSSNGQKRYGIVRSDFTYKPAAVAIKNTIALLRDDLNQNNLTDFRFLNFSIDTQATDIENSLLYHAGKDKYYLALWRGIFNDTAIDADPFPVTIDFAKNIASVAAYKPNESNFSTIVPIAGNSVTVNINDKVTFLEIGLQPTATTTPVAPSQLAATNSGPTGVKLTWKDRSHNEEGFGIERNDGLFGWRLIGTVNANTTSFVDRIQSGKNYRYRVRAVNDKGHSQYTQTISHTSQGAIIINDTLDNFNLIAAKSSQVAIATPQTTPLKYDGDLNFVSSSSSTPEYIVYHQPNLKDFTVTSYGKSTSSNFEVLYYSSPDGINWSPLEVNLNRVPTNLGQDTDVIFTTPKEILPDLTAYLKIEFSGIINLEEGIGNIKLIAAAN